jgi:CHAT domain-containing protein
MAARRRAAFSDPTNQPAKQSAARGSIFFSIRLLIALLLILAIASIVLFLKLRSTVSAEVRAARALVEAFSDYRPIEARLAGGFKGAEFKAQDAVQSGRALTELGRARELIAEAAAANNPGIDLTYSRLLLLEGKTAEANARLRSVIVLLPASAEAHSDLGACLIEQGKLEDARDELDKALTIQPKMPEALFNRALCYQHLLLRASAREDFLKSLDIERDPNWRKEIQHRLDEVSRPVEPQKKVADIVSEFDAAFAENDTETAMRIGKDYPEQLRGHALRDVTFEYLKTATAGDWPKADSALSELQLIGTASDRSVTDLAEYLRRLSQAEQASQLELIGKYVGTARQPTSSASAARTLEGLQLDFRRTKNLVFETLSAFQVADRLCYEKRFADSIRLLREYLPMTEQRNWPQDRARYLTQLGFEVSRLGEDSLGIKYCEEALSLCVKYPQLGSQALQRMSVPYLQLGDLDAALLRLRQSTTLILGRGLVQLLHQSLAYNYFQIASIYNLRDQPELALRYAREALDFAKQGSAHAYAAEFSAFVAFQYARLGQFEEPANYLKTASDYLKQVEEGRGRDFTETQMLKYAAETAMLLGDNTTAIAELERAESLAKKDEGATLQTIDVLNARAKARILSSADRDGEGDLMQAVKLIERYRYNLDTPDERSHFLDASQSVFDQLIALEAGSLRHPDLAFDMSERSHGRALLEEINRRAVFGLDTRGSSSLSSIQPLTLGAVQPKLPGDLCVLQFAVTNQRTYIFVVTRDSFKVFESAATTSSLDRSVQSYLADLRSVAPIEQVNEKARSLYDDLIKPIESYLPANAALCIVPDKALHYLPFAALLDSSNRYLMESHRLTYAPSASTLIECIAGSRLRRSSGPERILAVGNPAFDPQGFPGLPALSSAEREADESARVYGSGAVVLKQADATEPRVRAAFQDCNVAHLATHCLVQEGSPWLAALVLAGAAPAESINESRSATARSGSVPAYGKSPEQNADPNDGLIFLSELYSMKMPHARLVVLSACQTAVGQYYRGEGIVSLVRPFLTVGVPAVVASLWSIDSDATTTLMIEFHRQRKNLGRDAGEALRVAQQRLARHGPFQHPYYWAPFVLVGSNN